MGILSKIFTWWNGATIGTALFTRLHGEEVGVDTAGNRYYRSRGKRSGSPREVAKPDRERRWVIYAGANDASNVPAEWHGWLHGQYDELPKSRLPPPRVWEAEYTPNRTGTPDAYRPEGASPQRGRRTGDYQAWTPDGG